MTDTNKVDVEPFSYEPVMYGTPWGDLVPASALAALRQEIITKNAPEIEKVNAYIKQVEAERDTLRTQLAEAQAEAARYRSALVGMMACTLRADCPPDIYDAAEKALKGDV
jgi:outer membrane murein-binding lipoprotein Lpp